MPIDPLKINPNSALGRKSILGRSNIKGKKRVNFADGNGDSKNRSSLKELEKYAESNRKHAKAITMKIRLNSIRDRWLMNIRPFDYEIYVASSFMLIRTKEEIQFLRDTGMTKLGIKDANNLLHFLE